MCSVNLNLISCSTWVWLLIFCACSVFLTQAFSPYPCLVAVIFQLPTMSAGGSTLYIETALKNPFERSDKKEPGSIEITGNLGNVMKESAHLAYSFARAYMARHHPDNQILQHAQIHLHIPEVSVQNYRCMTVGNKEDMIS